jgi:hypothetical protein
VRVSQHFKLGVSQPSLEFLDVDTQRDTRVFVDPASFDYINSAWGKECRALLQSFYDEVLAAIRTGNRRRGLELLAHAGESNEVHLGLSRGISRGNGVGPTLAADIYDALATSAAVASGLTRDVQDTLLFVDGIGHDRVSDMTINVIRRPLIEFTQRMCVLYGIRTQSGIEAGYFWNRKTLRWSSGYASFPVVRGKKLLLVPKAIVRKNTIFDAGEYLTHFVLPHLVDVELENIDSPLIQRYKSKRKRGQKYVTKKSIRKRDGKPTKKWNTEATNETPELLEKYRASRADKGEPPPHDEVARFTDTEQPDWDTLLANVRSIPSGRKHADDYHRAVQILLNALFYPALDFPDREVKTHEGRKRIDIVYTNLASSGFFKWLDGPAGVECGEIIVECKNYTGPLSNPEFDQLTGRFSPRRGRFGLLVYRGYKDDKETVVKRCRDAALDDRGYVIALDDDDLAELVQARKRGEETTFRYLRDRYRQLI